MMVRVTVRGWGIYDAYESPRKYIYIERAHNELRFTQDCNHLEWILRRVEIHFTLGLAGLWWLLHFMSTVNAPFSLCNFILYLTGSCTLATHFSLNVKQQQSLSLPWLLSQYKVFVEENTSVKKVWMLYKKWNTGIISYKWAAGWCHVPVLGPVFRRGSLGDWCIILSRSRETRLGWKWAEWTIVPSMSGSNNGPFRCCGLWWSLL